MAMAATPAVSSAAAARRRGAGAYDADAIETLEGLEAVRQNPGMYIGSVGSEGLMHLVWEIVDNAVDEAAAGHARKVKVVFHRDGSVEVADDGRGIPVDTHAKREVSALEVVFTELHAGGKFTEGAYSTSGGLHGVGASVVNAMSRRLDAEVRRQGRRWELSFHKQEPGHFTGDRFRPSHNLVSTRVNSKATGTRIRFWPDTDLFEQGASFDVAAVRSRLRQICFLVPGLRVQVFDNRPGRGENEAEPFEFVSRGGLTDLVKERSQAAGQGSGRTEAEAEAVSGVITVNGIETFTERIPVEGQITEVERECTVDVALCWTGGHHSDIVSFVNTIPTAGGGTHTSGFGKALTRVVNNVVLKNNRKLAKLAREGDGRAGREDTQEGLVAAVKVSLVRPQFRGQTKNVLSTPAVDGITSRIVYEQLKEWFEPGGGPRSQVRAITDKLASAVANRVALRRRQETLRKASRVGSAKLPGKLADCRVHGPEAELVLVEGDSAAGPAKRGRDSEFMAILPLRGKIVNAAKAGARQVLDNAEAKAIFAAMGAGVGPDFNIDEARYGRIVILCDADVDGSHIRCLLLTLIHKYMTDMLAQGRVYSAQPPLFTAKVGTKTYRAYSETERDEINAELSRGRSTPVWQRFKGLGEMNTDELRHCALDPATRTLRRLTMADAEEELAAAEMFDVLMGNDVSRRRDYLVGNSALMDAAELDI